MLLAFAHIHGEAGTPTLAIWSAMVGRNGPFVSVWRREGGRGELFPYKMIPVSPHSTSPRLRTGESMHLVCFWPSPTPRARREHQLWPSGVRWWVGMVRLFLCAEGWRLLIIIMPNDPGLASFDITPSLHGRINAPSLLLAFAHIHGEAGTPTLAIWSAMVGRNGPFVSVCRRVAFAYFHTK
jgi:hypothetical protein